MNTIDPTAAVLAAPIAPKHNIDELRAGFDALLVQQLLQASGLMRGLEGEESILGETFTQVMASELAKQLDLGLGRMVVDQLAQDGTTPSHR